jgi:hypothetical protein
MIEFHDPRGDVGVEMQPYTLAFDLKVNGGQGATVGLLANGFPDSENFLRHIGSALNKLLPNVSLKFWNKGNASIPAPDDMLAEIKASCQIAIAAYGH